jgi:EAL domain-containing protein (putative c-di-GMP-specific phosphodiesterase class I)
MEFHSSGVIADFAEKIIERLSEAFQISGYEIFVGASVGISIFPDDATEVESLIKNADVAMYRAKELGRGRFQFFTEDMNTASTTRLEMETGMRTAIEKGEFELFYQPIVRLDSGKIVGAEALIRWNRPGQGTVPPDLFIPLAEETGIITEIGDWVLRSAYAQNRMWQDKGLSPISMAVNLSARQLKQKDLVEKITGILETSGLEHKYAELELIERALMDEADLASVTMHLLNNAGIKIGIDDFGTGYSSLSYLNRFPVHKLKIDRSFISGIPSESSSMAITKAIINLAKGLGIRVVAEGVESEQQKAFLLKHGCDEIQGYLFSKPLPADQFEALLKKHAHKA